jgi:hypothetical protein
VYRTLLVVLGSCLLLALAGCNGDEETPTEESAQEPTGPVPTRLLLRATTPGVKPTGPVKPTRQVRVKDRDVVSMVTTIPEGDDTPKDAHVKITIERGPAGTLRATAGGESGEPTSSARISSRGGNNIRAEQVRYTCFVPPAPTFCPVETVTTRGAYELVAPKPAQGPIVFAFTVARAP